MPLSLAALFRLLLSLFLSLPPPTCLLFGSVIFIVHLLAFSLRTFLCNIFLRVALISSGLLALQPRASGKGLSLIAESRRRVATISSLVGWLSDSGRMFLSRFVCRHRGAGVDNSRPAEAWLECLIPTKRDQEHPTMADYE